MGEGRGEGEGMKEDAPTSILPRSGGGRKRSTGKKRNSVVARGSIFNFMIPDLMRVLVR